MYYEARPAAAAVARSKSSAQQCGTLPAWRLAQRPCKLSLLKIFVVHQLVCACRFDQRSASDLAVPRYELISYSFVEPSGYLDLCEGKLYVCTREYVF